MKYHYVAIEWKYGSGGAAEQDTHTQLLDQNGFYASLYNAQFTEAV